MGSTENTDPGRISHDTGSVFGIRMTLPQNDPLATVLGSDSEMFRWYATVVERDAALAEMMREHLYSRTGDRPQLMYEKVERDKPAEYTRKPTL